MYTNEQKGIGNAIQCKRDPIHNPQKSPNWFWVVCVMQNCPKSIVATLGSQQYLDGGIKGGIHLIFRVKFMQNCPDPRQSGIQNIEMTTIKRWGFRRFFAYVVHLCSRLVHLSVNNKIAYIHDLVYCMNRLRGLNEPLFWSTIGKWLQLLEQICQGKIRHDSYRLSLLGLKTTKQKYKNI